MYFDYAPERDFSDMLFTVHSYEVGKSMLEQLTTIASKAVTESDGARKDRAEDVGRVCALRSYMRDGVFVYGLSYDPTYEKYLIEKYGDNLDTAFFCGSWSYYRVGEYLVQDYGLAIDATQPKVVKDSVYLSPSP